MHQNNAKHLSQSFVTIKGRASKSKCSSWCISCSHSMEHGAQVPGEGWRVRLAAPQLGASQKYPFSITFFPYSLEMGPGSDKGIPAVPTTSAWGTHLCSSHMHPPSHGGFCRIYWLPAEPLWVVSPSCGQVGLTSHIL